MTNIAIPPTEPYPFGTVLSIKPGRHELLTAVVFSSDPPKCGNGYRYRCLFPWIGHRPQVAKVYSDEILAVADQDAGDILCSGCSPATRERCRLQGITPQTCC